MIIWIYIDGLSMLLDYDTVCITAIDLYIPIEGYILAKTLDLICMLMYSLRALLNLRVTLHFFLAACCIMGNNNNDLHVTVYC